MNAGSTVSVSISDSGDVQLAGVLTFSTANQVLSEVRSIIQRQGETTLDCAGIVEANSAGLALLVEWKGIAQRSGRSLILRNVPPALHQLADVCQVSELLMLETAST